MAVENIETSGPLLFLSCFSCFLQLDIYRKRFKALKSVGKSKEHFFLSKYKQFAFKFVPETGT